MEQIDAVRQAMAAPLSVVTGPPGTGKSQAIVAMATTALWNRQRVLVASKNHQALDAVEDRLSGIAPDVHFIVRTLDPAREIDNSMTTVLAELESQPGGFRGPGPEPEVAAELDRRASTRVDALNEIARRRELRLQLAEDIERLESRRIAGIPEGDEADTSSPKIGFWRRFLQWLRLVPKSRSYVGFAGDDTLSTAALRQRIDAVQAQLASLGSVPDPVSMTREIEELAAKVLGRRIGVHSIPNEEQRLKLASARSDLELQGESQPDRNVAGLILDFRPLWLASVLGTPRRVPLHDSLFDLVIFDEASQCDIASALPLLARAKRAVIVGDDRQLAFIPQLGIAQDRNLMAAQRLPLRGMGRFAQSRKSLFDLARSTPGVPAVMLRDQYRSAADIVAYINHDFYGGKLRVAGDQDALRVPTKSRPGLAWTDVPARGSEDADSGNVNSAEISAIVTHLEELLLRQDYDGSIGIVSLFRPQVMALSEAVTARIPEDRRFAADLRIATVDGFQGEERDLILFSPVVYARVAHSAVAFLQKDWRRLNVAISRARAVAHVFGDLSYARSGAIRRLQSLAARATEPRRPPAEGIFDSAWERKLYGALRARKLDPQPVNGGGIMPHAERPVGPVAAAQNCATHGPLSVLARGGG
ncbi:MAG: ATP-binding protein, partial [Rhodospirillaceae bacterium]|nr:ATP-binding protein [Rhodospirillaceae bacterium]